MLIERTFIFTKIENTRKTLYVTTRKNSYTADIEYKVKRNRDITFIGRINNFYYSP